MAEWQWRWKATAGQPMPRAELCPLLYGKSWAYSVEIDDGPASTLAVSQPLLAAFTFTDAPVGVSGGKPQPLVGGAAVFPLRVGTGSSAYLEVEQVRQLEKQGWAVLNHGYAHIGNSWEPKGGLTAAQLREELYWSQAMLAVARQSQRSPTHFVYPNGYLAYQAHLGSVRLRSASRVGGKKPNLLDPRMDLLDLDRNYLDESVWSKPGDPLVGLPRPVRLGDWVIDFTHGMEAAPSSLNHQRWRERLRYLTSQGEGLWCAPTPTVVAYYQARQAAVVRVEPGLLRVALPDTLPGSRLTLKLTGMPALPPPPGTTLYRQGDTTWITTPVMGEPNVAPPAALECVYQGPAQDVRFAKPVRVAGVRLLQKGPTAPGYRVTLALTTASGLHSLADTALSPNWGCWLLYALCPNAPALLATGVALPPDPALTTMEVWALR